MVTSEGQTIIAVSTMATAGQKGAQYHTKCTGNALETVNAHSDEADVTLFGANLYAAHKHAMASSNVS